MTHVPHQGKDSRIKYLAFDPGLTVGWAAFDESGKECAWGQTPWDNVGKILDTFGGNLIAVICEDYVINPHVSHGGSKVETVRVIGMMQEYCRANNVPLVLQPPRIKKIGYAWAGRAPLPKSQHAQSHQFDALAHGVYYLQKNGIRKSVLDE